MFSRCTDESYIAGTLNHNKYSYLQHCYDWSMARNNLRAEFVPPVQMVPNSNYGFVRPESDSDSICSDEEQVVKV